MDEKIFFDDFEIDTLKRCLLKAGRLLPLDPKAFDLLVALVNHRGVMVSKQELLDVVWTNQFVEEKNLTVHVTAIRRALGETTKEHRFIVTVPGYGYKFVAKLNPISKNGFAPGNDAKDLPDEVRYENKAPKQRKRRNHSFLVGGLSVAVLILVGISLYYFLTKPGETISSLAVLPFVNVGADPKTEYLADGITESLIDNLSQSPNLKVIAHGSVNRYKVAEGQNQQLDLVAVARDLGGVQSLLTGRIESRNDDMLISVELIDVKSKVHLWGARFNRKFADVFSVQDEIARNISDKLRVKFDGNESREIAKRYTDNIKAFENYTMGRAYIHRRTREDLLTAVRYYEEAINLDQDYALAYAGLAEAYGNLGVRGYMSPAEGRQKLQEAAKRAVQLDNNLADAHVAMGYYYTGFAPYDFSAGDREFERAIELSPSLAIAHLYLSLSLLRQGRFDDGLKEMLTAHDLDPFSSIITRQRALYYTLTRDSKRALEILRQANEMGPTFTTTTEIGIYIQNGLYDEALSEIKKAGQQRPNDPILIYNSGMVYSAMGRQADALESIKELERLSADDTRQAQWIAKIYAMLGRTDDAFGWLGRGLDANEIGAFYLDDPAWDTIRKDPRFKDLMVRMGIPQR